MAGSLRIHDRLLGRYEILAVLGRGGMGDVYKACDHGYDDTAFNRIVAIKTIRPELAGKRELIRRFKQEIFLSQQIGHPNVVRVSELMESDGLVFVVMEYIDGQDLACALKEKQRFPPAAAIDIIRQAALGLSEVHAHKVLHRDLKPANFMLARDGRAVLMDFGLAKSEETLANTQTTELLGTPVYMSPEQLKNDPVDARTDIYSLGLILYELLTGTRPFASDNPFSEAASRIKQPPPDVHTLDPDIPGALSHVVSKCLATDRDKRFRSADELVDALDTLSAPPRKLPSKYVIAALAAVLSLAVAAAGWLVVNRNGAPPSAHPVRILIADIADTTADPAFHGTLEQMFTIALEDASFITAYPRVQALRAAKEIVPGAERLDEAMARTVAAREGINNVITSRITRAGTGYELSVRTVEGVSGKVVFEKSDTAANRNAVLDTVSRLATSLRKALGDYTSDTVLSRRAETFTAGSIDAMQAYALGQQKHLEGSHEQAAEHYRRAIALDPQMGRAYAGLGVSYHNLMQWDQSERYYQQALAHLDRMTEREKLRTRGGYYIHRNNAERAIEEYTSLVERYPADNAGLSNLALAYFYRRDMKMASQYGRRAADLYPLNVFQRTNVAWYALYSGDFETAEREATEAIKLNPAYPKGTLIVGLTHMARERYDEAGDIYLKLHSLGPRGKVFAAQALFDLAMLRGRPQEAHAHVASVPAGEVMNVSQAEALWESGEKAKALSLADSVAASARSIGASIRAGILFVRAGQLKRAEDIGKTLADSIERSKKANGLALLAEVAMAKGQFADAAMLLERSRTYEDTWWGRWASARAWFGQQRFAEAHSDVDDCLRRQGEALAAFLDDVPTARYLPPVRELRRQIEAQLKSDAGARVSASRTR